MFAVEEEPSQKGRNAETVLQVTAAPTIDEEELPDGGLRAWVVVVGCFVVNAVTVGFWWVFPQYFPNRQLTSLASSLVSDAPT